MTDICAFCTSAATKTFEVPKFIEGTQTAKVCDRHHVLLTVKYPKSKPRHKHGGNKK